MLKHLTRQQLLAHILAVCPEGLTLLEIAHVARSSAVTVGLGTLARDLATLQEFGFVTTKGESPNTLYIPTPRCIAGRAQPLYIDTRIPKFTKSHTSSSDMVYNSVRSTPPKGKRRLAFYPSR